MTIFDESLLRPYVSAVEETTRRTLGGSQLQAALTLGKGQIALVPNQADALPVAALAAVALAETGTFGTIHLVATEAERLAPLFQKFGVEKSVRCAPAEAFVFDYLKGEVTTDDAFCIVANAEQVLLHDANTPVILAHPVTEQSKTVPAEAKTKADALLQKGRDYIVKQGEIVVREPESGKLFRGRRFADGMHGAIQAREGISVEAEANVIAQVRMADYFRQYQHLAGVATNPDERYSTQYHLSVE